RFELRRAAERLDGDAGERLSGDVIQSPPSTWLLHPLHPPPGRDYRFRVRGATFASGVRRVAPDTYGADVTTLADAPYSVFGRVTLETLSVPGGAIDIAFVPTTAEQIPRPAVVKRMLARAGEVVSR